MRRGALTSSLLPLFWVLGGINVRLPSEFWNAKENVEISCRIPLLCHDFNTFFFFFFDQRAISLDGWMDGWPGGEGMKWEIGMEGSDLL